MSVSYTVGVNDPTHAADFLGGTLVEDFSAAVGDWLEHLSGGGSVDFEIDIRPTAAGRAESAPAVVVPDGTEPDGTPLYEPGTLYELRTGVDPNGAAPDATISIDPAYLEQGVWADPTPADTTDAVPGDRVDLVSVLRHETGHMLGIISATPGVGDPAPWDTTFDRLTVARADGTFFVGEHARAVYGGDVPLTTLPGSEANSHLGNSLAEPAGVDLMNGVAFYLGTRYEVSALDLAILEDIGAPIVPQEPLVVASAGAGGTTPPQHAHHGPDGQEGNVPLWHTAHASAHHDHWHHDYWT